MQCKIGNPRMGRGGNHRSADCRDVLLKWMRGGFVDLLSNALRSPIAALVLAMLILLASGLGALLLFWHRRAAEASPASQAGKEAEHTRRAA